MGNSSKEGKDGLSVGNKAHHHVKVVSIEIVLLDHGLSSEVVHDRVLVRNSGIVGGAGTEPPSVFLLEEVLLIGGEPPEDHGEQREGGEDPAEDLALDGVLVGGLVVDDLTSRRVGTLPGLVEGGGVDGQQDHVVEDHSSGGQLGGESHLVVPSVPIGSGGVAVVDYDGSHPESAEQVDAALLELVDGARQGEETED